MTICDGLVIRAVVTDGVSIGHWCCSASSTQPANLAQISGLPPPNGPCLNPLKHIYSRFCDEHLTLFNSQCQAQPCTLPVIPGSKTCGLKSHVEAAKQFDIQGNSNFKLHSILNQPGASLPIDPTVHQDENTGDLGSEELAQIQDANEADREEEKNRDGQGNGAPKMSRHKTHNDQLIVGTCGVIIARQALFNADSVSAVKVGTHHTFSPSFFFYCILFYIFLPYVFVFLS